MNDRALLDRIALTDLVMRYCRGIDRRDFALVRSLYHDDAIDDHGHMFCGTADDFVAWLPGVMAHWDMTIHSISNSLFAIEGDRAEGEHYAMAFHRSPAPDARELIIWGRYLDQYERRAGEWKFLKRQLVFDHGSIRPVDAEGLAQLGADAPNGTADGQDPSWALALLRGLFREMTTPLEPLEARLQALEDKEAIRTLIARYGPLADSGDAEGVAQLWTEDGSYAIAGFGEARGHAEIAAFITGATHKQLMADGCGHIMSPVAIELKGDGATARGHSMVIRWTGSNFEVARMAANCWTLKRLPEGWRVTHRDNAQLKGDDAARALFAGV